MIFAIIFIIGGLIDLLGSAAWASWYFRFGIPVFSKQAKVSLPGDGIESYLNEIVGGIDVPQLVVSELSHGSFALRERGLGLGGPFQYIPVAHALLRISPNGESIRLVGRLNVSFMLFFLAAWLPLPRPMPWGLIGLFAAFSCIFMLGQVRRYGSFLNSLRELKTIVGSSSDGRGPLSLVP